MAQRKHNKLLINQKLKNNNSGTELPISKSCGTFWKQLIVHLPNCSIQEVKHFYIKLANAAQI